jgi:hypothetical protein
MQRVRGPFLRGKSGRSVKLASRLYDACTFTPLKCLREPVPNSLYRLTTFRYDSRTGDCVLLATVQYCHVIQWLQVEFRLVIRLIEHVKILTTSNCNSLTGLHTDHCKYSTYKVFYVFASRLLVTALSSAYVLTVWHISYNWTGCFNWLTPTLAAISHKPPTLIFTGWLSTNSSSESESESELLYDRRYSSQSVRLGVKSLRLTNRDFFFLTEPLRSLSLCNILSDEKMGLSLMNMFGLSSVSHI